MIFQSSFSLLNECDTFFVSKLKKAESSINDSKIEFAWVGLGGGDTKFDHPAEGYFELVWWVKWEGLGGVGVGEFMSMTI